jgi:hypothetical protein
MQVTGILSIPKLGISAFLEFRAGQEARGSVLSSSRQPVENGDCGILPGRDELRALKLTALQMSLLHKKIWRRVHIFSTSSRKSRAASLRFWSAFCRLPPQEDRSSLGVVRHEGPAFLKTWVVN